MPNHILYLVRLDSIQKNARGADRKLAEYILSHTDTVTRLTVQTLAEKTETSYATVCRFFRKLGADGFREFKKSITEELAQNQSFTVIPPEFDIDSHRSVSFDEIGRRICDYSSSIVGNCHKFLKDSRVEDVVTLLGNADHIHFIGLGTSAVTAQYAHTKFFRLKPGCSFDTDIILSKMKAAQLGRGNVLFAISSSGRTKSILEIARVAHDHNATVISVCDFVDSPLANLSDISICTTVRESNKYIDTDFPLIQGQITIIDILYACLYHRTPNAASANFQKTKKAVDADKLT